MIVLSNALNCMFIFNYLNRLMAYLFPTMKSSTIQIFLSTNHALFSSICSFLYLCKIIQEESYIHLVSILLGFTLYDIGCIITIRNRIWKQMLFHHIMIVISLFPIVYYSFTNVLLFPTYAYYIAMNYLVEISTIPLNLSWYLNENNKNHSILFKITSALTIASYLPFRVVNTLYLTFYTFFYEPHILPFQEIQLIFAILNIIWFSKLCKKAKNILKNKAD